MKTKIIIFFFILVSATISATYFINNSKHSIKSSTNTNDTDIEIIDPRYPKEDQEIIKLLQNINNEYQLGSDLSSISVEKNEAIDLYTIKYKENTISSTLSHYFSSGWDTVTVGDSLQGGSTIGMVTKGNIYCEIHESSTPEISCGILKQYARNNNINNINNQKVDKLNLCSNKYYKTEYNDNGKIIISDWPRLEIEKTGPNTETHQLIFGTLEQIKDLTCVQELNELPCNKDIDLEILKNLKNLEILNLQPCFLTDNSLAVLKNFPKLTTLHLGMHQIYDSKIFSSLPKLKTLTLFMGPGGILDLVDLPTSIEWLNINCNNTTPNLCQIKNCQHIKNLINLRPINNDPFLICEKWQY